MLASMGGNINIVNALLRINSYVNLCDRDGNTSLIHAAKAGYVPIVEALIEAHANVDHQDQVSSIECTIRCPYRFVYIFSHNFPSGG